MKININLLLITSLISFSAFSSENSKKDDEQLLLTSCQSLTATPEQEDAKACIYFIQGFVAAAHTIDPPVINNKSQKKPGYYGSMSRPYRNWRQISPTRFFPFCVPDNTSKSDVIKTVSKLLYSQYDTKEMLEIDILKALKNKYPCRKTY